MKTSCGKNEATEEAYCEMLHQHIEQLSTDDLKENAFSHLYEEHRYSTVEEIYNMLNGANISKENKKLLQKHYGLPQSGMKRIKISCRTVGHIFFNRLEDITYEVPKKFALNLVTYSNFEELLKPYYIATNNIEYTEGDTVVNEPGEGSFIDIKEMGND
jgi:hypothetical protein